MEMMERLLSGMVGQTSGNQERGDIVLLIELLDNAASSTLELFVSMTV
jgi:hypothetical protein